MGDAFMACWIPPRRIVGRAGLVLLSLTVLAGVKRAHTQFLVPGTGNHVGTAGDNLEDENWTYNRNDPKSSKEQDEQVRSPIGQSSNGMWVESRKRGHPDVVERVPTPEGGLADSTGALKLRTLYSGIPSRLTNRMMQDDFILNVTSQTGGMIPVQRSPSCVVRVYLPPFEQWEDRTGSTFGMRADVQTTTTEMKGRRGIFSRLRQTSKIEPYWPGMFIQFNSETDPGNEKDSAVLIIRCAENGQDVTGPQITQTGWWTLGMSFTPDGRVHYFASPGVDDLTAADHVASYYPYGYRAQYFHTIFFNVVNQDDGRSWSTEWIIDDPTIYWQ